MADIVVTVFDDIKSWFAKVWKKVPSDIVVAQSALNAAAPIFEEVVTVVDPALAVVVDPIVTVVQIDLGTVSALLKAGTVTNISTLLAAIKANFSTLLSEAHITDTETVAKANTFLSILESIATSLGTAI